MRRRGVEFGCPDKSITLFQLGRRIDRRPRLGVSNHAGFPPGPPCQQVFLAFGPTTAHRDTMAREGGLLSDWLEWTLYKRSAMG
jgi:hypothetical protein